MLAPWDRFLGYCIYIYVFLQTLVPFTALDVIQRRRPLGNPVAPSLCLKSSLKLQDKETEEAVERMEYADAAAL